MQAVRVMRPPTTIQGVPLLITNEGDSSGDALTLKPCMPCQAVYSRGFAVHFKGVVCVYVCRLSIPGCNFNSHKVFCLLYWLVILESFGVSNSLHEGRL